MQNSRTVRGGTGLGDPFNGGLSGDGAGDVNQSPRYFINIMTSVLAAGYEVVTEQLLRDYAVGYNREMEKSAGNPMATFMYPESPVADEQLEIRPKRQVRRFMCSPGIPEGKDREMTQKITVDGIEHEVGDYQLSAVELDNLQRIANTFPQTVANGRGMSCLIILSCVPRLIMPVLNLKLNHLTIA